MSYMWHTNKPDQRKYPGYVNKKYTSLANSDGTDVAEANGPVNFMIG
ncbi:hypothetical protein [Prolixibacter sp. NT017]|nr:hypothetical protein [Prolixibacter sp. NT017]GET25683.1 hypothetical protein NT017_20120 [Prolixibacter sp. NT017]